MGQHSKKNPSPKYRRIADEILHEIRTTMGRGDKLPSETDLAKRFNVHVLTIREALKVLQEGGVIERKRAVGTHVVNPMGGKWVTILCEMDVYSPASESFYSRSVIYHLRHLFQEAGLFARVSIGGTEPSAEGGRMTSLDFVADLEGDRLAGVIALSTNPADWWVKKLEKQGVPLIGSNARYKYNVSHDPWSDMSKVIRSFLDHGRDRIAYLGWFERNDGKWTDPRIAKALEDMERCYPVNINRDWIKGEIHPEKSGAGWEEFRELWFSDEEKPNGIIIHNEHLLPDVERALEELGIRVPEDLMIIAYRTRGNKRVPKFPMVFIETDPRLVAFRMYESFMKLYRGEELTEETTLVQRLILEDSLRNENVSSKAK